MQHSDTCTTDASPAAASLIDFPVAVGRRRLTPTGGECSTTALSSGARLLLPRRLVQRAEQPLELAPVLRTKPCRPFALERRHRAADHPDRGDAAGGEVDPARAHVVGIDASLDVAELLELAEQVVHRLARHAG